VVDGSVRRAGEWIRISIELVDASAGIQIWSAHYSRELKDIFAVQDEITQKILGAIEPELAAAKWERTRGVSAENLDAWDHYRRGTWHLYRFGREDIAAAQRHSRAAIASDPDFPQSHAALAYASHLSLIFDYAEDRSKTLDEGLWPYPSLGCAWSRVDHHSVVTTPTSSEPGFYSSIGRGSASISEVAGHTLPGHYPKSLAFVLRSRVARIRPSAKTSSCASAGLAFSNALC